MPFRRMPWLAWVAVLSFLLAVSLPYLYALVVSGDRYAFSGLLFNPLDGNTYLAKMYQGFEGSWQFRLPYTSEPGQGAYLFLYYLFLGHAARLLGAPMILIYHLARLAGVLFLIYALYRFYAAILDEARLVWLAFGLALLGGGIGWLALPTGAVTADFWVAEAYPFLSAYANPHFPLSLGLLLWVLTPPEEAMSAAAPVSTRDHLLHDWRIAPLVILLALTSPFAIVIAALVLGAAWILDYLLNDSVSSAAGRIYMSRLVWTAAVGAPILIYDQWATMRSPQLSAWNAQNVTPAPALWDFLLSFSPLLILAVLAVWRLLKDRQAGRTASLGAWLVPLVWVFLAILLLYTPLNLQRRFILGLYAPLCALAVSGAAWLAAGHKSRFRLIAFVLFVLVLPTNLLVLLAAQHGIQTHDPLLYLHADEAAAMQWLRHQGDADALVLASPRTGLLIPAYTGLRVIYGHPYETVDAENKKQAVEDFYSGRWDDLQKQDYLLEQEVDYIYLGPQERLLGTFTVFPAAVSIYQSGSVTIYAVQPEQGAATWPAVLPGTAQVVW